MTETAAAVYFGMTDGDETKRTVAALAAMVEAVDCRS